MHHGKNPNVIRSENVYNGVRKRAPEMPSGGRRTEYPEKTGVSGYVRKQAINMPIKSLTKLKLQRHVPIRRVL